MQKYLPTSKYFSVNKTKGFTLIELLVVIAIIAILSIVGIALFSGVQSKARDNKRTQDVIAISKALEAQYKAGTGYSTAVDATWFADQQIPTNPNPGGAAYNSSGMSTSTFTVCANLENSTGNATSNAGAGLGTTSAGGFFCKKNSQ